MALTEEIIKRQDDVTSTALIEFLAENPQFIQLSKQEQKLIIDRDLLDAEALKAGIILAQEKKVLPLQDPKVYQSLAVEGKTSNQVADELISFLGEKAQSGCVVCLVGLSGTGKGTTVDKLKQKLPLACTWSNGNIFRLLTLLAAMHCEQEGKAFSAEVLTAENIATWVGYLSFGKNGSAWDTKIHGLGVSSYVSEIQNTLLKEPRVAANIPAVAQQTQGEVVKFAADACRQMGAGGSVVLLEGREQTLDFIPADFRFCLTLSDNSLLGKRRAAQRVAASALKRIGDADVEAMVKQCLEELV